jgi:hypothetical protein
MKVNGKVSLKNPQKRIWIMEDYYKVHSNNGKFDDYDVALRRIFLGVEIVRREKCKYSIFKLFSKTIHYFSKVGKCTTLSMILKSAPI